PQPEDGLLRGQPTFPKLGRPMRAPRQRPDRQQVESTRIPHSQGRKTNLPPRIFPRLQELRSDRRENQSRHTPSAHPRLRIPASRAVLELRLVHPKTAYQRWSRAGQGCGYPTSSKRVSWIAMILSLKNA